MTLFIDGASRGNPGESGFGVAATMKQVSPSGAGTTKSDAKFIEMYGYLGTATNNQAEYAALLAALAFAKISRARAVSIYSDSELLVRQMQGVYRVRDKTLRRLHGKALALSLTFDSFAIAHVPREKNKRADKLANAAVNLKKNRLPPGVTLEPVSEESLFSA